MSDNTSAKAPNQKQLTTHPHYFGAYLNIAHHNATVILAHLCLKYGMEYDIENVSIYQAPIVNFLDKAKNKPDITQSITRDLQNYFPFLQYDFFRKLAAQRERIQQHKDKVAGITGAVSLEGDPHKMKEDLSNLLFLLNTLRNQFSHYGTAADYSKTEDKAVSAIYEAALFRLIDRGNRTKRFNCFEAEHIEHLAQGSIFSPKPLKSHPDLENTIAFVTCLFLERKFAFPFLSRLKSFQEIRNVGDERIPEATHECYTMFCCRLPQPKLASSDILLDMLNELGRCPGVLYPLLSEEDQTAFHVGEEEDEDEDDPDSINSQGIFKRSGNRFPYFALRYFDDAEVFPNLRFDVHLGKWQTKQTYQKSTMGEKRDRVLSRPIHTYERLVPFKQLYEAIEFINFIDENGVPGVKMKVSEEYRSQFRDDWLDNVNGEGVYLKQEILQFSPQYNFGNNVIGIQFVKGEANIPVKYQLPPLPIKKGKSAKAILSTHELRDLFFYHLLHKTPKNGTDGPTIIEQDPEAFILAYLDRLENFLSDVKNGKFTPIAAPPDYDKNEPLPYFHNNPEKTKTARLVQRRKKEKVAERKTALDQLLLEKYGLRVKQIPSKIAEYLLAYQTPTFAERAARKFNAQLKATRQRLKDLRKGRSPKIGEQATYLAEDIVFLTLPTEHEVNGVKHKSKLNNDQFRILQSSLAYFSINKSKLQKFLERDVKVISSRSDKGHPFLHQIQLKQCSGILDFYETYLVVKQVWLEGVLERVNEPNAEQLLGDYLPPNTKPKPPLTLDYAKLPMYLPKGLFKAAITQAMAELPQFDFNIETKFHQYIEQWLAGDTQSFYQLARYHLDQDTTSAERTEEEVLENKLSQEREDLIERSKNHELDKQTAKDLRQQLSRKMRNFHARKKAVNATQTEDRLLWLMAQERQKRTDEHQEMDLGQLSLARIDRVLKDEVDVNITVPGTEMKITDRLPLRRYGDLRRIAKDRRLPNLVRYYQQFNGTDSIPHDTIKAELEQYDRRRIQFFALIYEFEKAVSNHFSQEIQALRRDKAHITHIEFVKVAAAGKQKEYFYRQQLAKLRNKFFHNQFPWYDWLVPQIASNAPTLFSDQVFDFATTEYQRFLTEL